MNKLVLICCSLSALFVVDAKVLAATKLTEKDIFVFRNTALPDCLENDKCMVYLQAGGEISQITDSSENETATDPTVMPSNHHDEEKEEPSAQTKEKEQQPLATFDEMFIIVAIILLILLFVVFFITERLRRSAIREYNTLMRYRDLAIADSKDIELADVESELEPNEVRVFAPLHATRQHQVGNGKFNTK